MRVIHSFKHYFLTKPLFIILAVALLLPTFLSGIRVFASFAGGGKGAMGYSSGPGYEFDGLYTLSQNYTEINPNSAGVYTISDYTVVPTLWIDKTQINSGNQFYAVHNYKVYDETESEIEVLSDTTGHRSDYVGNGSKYLMEDLTLSLSGKYTDHIFELYDVDPTTNGKGETLLETVSIRLAYADYNASSVPSITITDVRQAGEHLHATNPYDNDYWYVQYDNRLDLEVDFHVENLLPGMFFRSYVNSDEIIFDSSKSDYTIKYYATPQTSSPYYLINYYAFKNPNNYSYEGHSSVYFNSSASENIPYFSIDMIYLDTGERFDSSANPNAYMLDIDVHNYVERPLGIKIEGQNYEDNTEYTIDLITSSRIGEPTAQVLTKTGAELNSGIVVPYNQQIGPITIQDLMTKSMNPQGYDVICNIGYTTKGLGFWYYPSSFWAMADMFNSIGNSFTQYSSPELAGGDAGLIYGTISYVNIDQSLLTDNLYFGFNTSQGEIENYDYYLFRSDSSDNNFTNKQLLTSGSVTAGNPAIINVGGLPSSGTTYSVVLTHNDIVDFVYHYQVNIVNSNSIDTHTLSFGASSENSPVFVNYASSFSTVYNSETNIQILMSNADSEKTYQLKVEGLSDDFEYTGNVSGSSLDGSTTLFTLPAVTSSEQTVHNSYGVSVSYDNHLVAESYFGIQYTDTEFILNQAHVYDDLLTAAQTQIANDEVPEGSFSATLTAPETFEGEFDVYLSVGDYDRIIGNCVGICGIVGELDYDDMKLELVSAEPLAGFEMEQGNKIVLYKATGVEDGTNIMKLHFRNLGMSANETTTISFNNIEGSDGVNNIPTASTSASTRYDVPFRFIRSRIFSSEGYEIMSKAGTLETESTHSLAYQIPTEIIDNNKTITVYYDGYGFEADKTYSYTLTNATLNQEVAIGSITGQELNDGTLNIELTSFSTSANSDYTLTINEGNTLLYTYTDNFWITEESDLYINFGYGYNEAGLANGFHTTPYGTDVIANIKTNGLDSETSYEVGYDIVDYSSCTEGHNENGHVENCTEDEAANHSTETVVATGAELEAGKEIILPAPETTTIRRKVTIYVKNPDETSIIENLRHNETYINFVDPENVVDSIGEHAVDDSLVLSKISPNTLASSLLNDFSLASGYQSLVFDKDGVLQEENSLISTGSKIVIKDSHDQLVLEYTAKIKGDTSSDGRVTVLDLVQAKRHLAGIATLEGIYAEAGDITDSGFIGITDVVKICRHVAGIEEIRQ